MTYFEHRIANFIGGASLLEWFFGAITMSWGLVLLWPGETFLNPFYVELARLLQEEQWGWFLVAWGAVRVGALLATGFCRWAHVLRAACAMFGIGVFTAIAIAFLAANAEGLSIDIATYACCAIFDFISALRAGVDIGESGVLSRKKPHGSPAIR